MRDAGRPTCPLPRRLATCGARRRGWIWGSYTHQAHIGVDSWLADLLPFSSSFTGHLEAAEALYDGPNGSLVGVRTFINETPQLAVVLGMTRSGKSVFMTDFLSQIALITTSCSSRRGLELRYLQPGTSKPIIVHPDSTLCINYLEPTARRQQLHIDMASSLVCKLVGSFPIRRNRTAAKGASPHLYPRELYN